MTSTRTYDALIQFVNSEFDKLRETLTVALNKARDDAGPEDAFDVTLGLANKLALYGLQVAVGLHSTSLDSSRSHEARMSFQFPPN